MSNLIDMVEDDHYDGPEMRSIQDIMALFDTEKPEAVAIDTESSTFRWHQDRADAFAITLSWGRTRTFYVPCGVDIDFEQARQAAILANHIFMTCPRVIFHNAKYDLHVFKRLFDNFRIPLITRRIDDTMLLSAILNESRHHGLKELTSSMGIEYIQGVDADLYKNEISLWIEEQERMTGRKPGYDEAPKRLMVPYAAQDAYLTLALWIAFMEELLEQDRLGASNRAKLMDTYLMELRLIWVIWAAEERGMAIDMEFINKKIAELTPMLEVIKMEMHEQFGFDMNPGSTEDVARALKSIGVQGEWTNPRTGKQKLPEWELERLDHPVAKRVLEYRTAQKMLTGYYEVLANDNHLADDGHVIVHPNFKQNGARTARMSITEPALQTIPREKGEVRGAFIARKGHKLIFADYSGQELRVLAHYLRQIGDETMYQVFVDGGDLHRETAAAILEKDPKDVTKTERQAGKNTNFAIVYGAGAKKIAFMWGRDEAFGKQALYRLYDRFPGIRKIKKLTTQAGDSRGYVQTSFGRRHHKDERTPSYRLLNYLIQGSSAELTKSAMIAVDQALIDSQLEARILLSVHDEIIVEAPDEEVEAAQAIMEHAMTTFPIVTVPLEVESAVAVRWSEK